MLLVAAVLRIVAAGVEFPTMLALRYKNTSTIIR